MIEEKDIPVSCQAAAACELLGIDPLYVANEGKAVLVVRPQSAGQILGSLKKHPLGRKASLIGEIKNNPARRVVLNTALGTQRIVDMLSGEPLPRIC
jgi:hydrogenase expression/formation protein HypE